MAARGTLNRVMIIGNFGSNPELRSLPGGTAVSNFSVATSETWHDKNAAPGEERKELTEWHRVTFFGRQAEVLHEYGRKGSKVYVEGSLHTRKWTDKDGNDRYTTEIRGREFTFLSPPSQRDRDERGARGDDYNASRGGYDNHMPDDDEDDIPF